jgi:hypothetical protein
LELKKPSQLGYRRFFDPPLRMNTVNLPHASVSILKVIDPAHLAKIAVALCCTALL